jgi:hypothetical protein
MWKIISTSDYDAWFASLNASAAEEVFSVLLLLEEYGPLLARPFADTLKGSAYANMKELRVTGRGLAIRIAFAFDPRRRAVLLVAGDKRGVSQRRFYGQLIARADALYKRHLKDLR